MTFGIFLVTSDNKYDPLPSNERIIDDIICKMKYDKEPLPLYYGGDNHYDYYISFIYTNSLESEQQLIKLNEEMYKNREQYVSIFAYSEMEKLKKESEIKNQKEADERKKKMEEKLDVYASILIHGNLPGILSNMNRINFEDE
jgi:hypothetical protein